ncbi:MAG TPA: hypothetical protein VLT45_14280 [Kofleriaceae bacterium]|nr:hypothetical protein [Kofleriaceae bacterium]
MAPGGPRYTDGRPREGDRPTASPPGARLAAIVARNTRPPWYANKLVRGLIFAALVLICLALVAFTDLAKPKTDAKPAGGSAAVKAPADHVDGVYLSPGTKRK